MDDDSLRLEQAQFISASRRRRWGMIAVGTALLLLGEPFGLPETSVWLVGSFFVVGAATNLGVSWIVRRCVHRWWFGHLMCWIDICLVGIAVTSIGPGGTIVGFLFVVIPCSFWPNRSLGIFAAFTSSIAYVLSVFLHPVIAVEYTGIRSTSSSVLLLEVFLFLAVALALQVAPNEILRRIRSTRLLVGNAASGTVGVSAPADRNDSVGMLEKSLNDLMSRTSQLFSEVANYAGQIASAGDLIARHAGFLLDSSERNAAAAKQISSNIDEQRSLAEAGQLEGTVAARDVADLSLRAKTSEDETRQLISASDVGRERVGAVEEALLAIGTDVRQTSSIIEVLRNQSRQIGSFALAITKIARHTHVLALNAAIEAAHADEHGKGFAVVADQVRTLAGEAGKSARDVANLIAEMQAGIESAADTMATGAERVTQITVATSEARVVLDDVHTGVSQLSELLSETVENSSSQTDRIGGLAEVLSQLAASTAMSSADVGKAEDIIARERSAIDELTEASQHIGELAEKLREVFDSSSPSSGEGD